MKKLLSIILAILMIVTTAPFAFAAEETPDYSDAKVFTGDEPAGAYDCLCNSDNWFVKNIILKIVQIILDLFGIDFECSCSSDNVMIGESLVSDIPEENPASPAMPQPGMY